MLENTLANGERPEELIVYAGTGKVARDWASYHRIVDALTTLGDDETLIVQSGKPVAVFPTHGNGPRVLIANTNLVGKWATWEHYRELEANGLIMYGQYTAGSWAYIGTQGILQGTLETFGTCAHQHFDGNLNGRIVLTAGLGGMGGAQPLAVKMLGGVCLAIEIDPARIERRLETGYCDTVVATPEAAVEVARTAAANGEAVGIALRGNAAEIVPRLLALGLEPAIVTDQTSAHDPLNGYIPLGHDLASAAELRNRDREGYIAQSIASMASHVAAIVGFKDRGAIAFEYGNGIREQAVAGGETRAFVFQSFVPLFIRPSFCRGRGPFRWVCLSGDPADLARTDAAIIAAFPDDAVLQTWMSFAQAHVPIQNLPARTCWLGLDQRRPAGLLFNRMVRDGELTAPVAMSRDHLDGGSVAQPTRETEGMLDGSDAVADWPLLNALLNATNGADLVAIHQGGGSGMGGSISAGLTVIADGSEAADKRIARVLFADPGMGVVRHADAGYEDAIAAQQAAGLRMPSLDE